MVADLRNVAAMAESHDTADNSDTNVVAPQGSSGVTPTWTGTTASGVATATHAAGTCPHKTMMSA